MNNRTTAKPGYILFSTAFRLLKVCYDTLSNKKNAGLHKKYKVYF